jgi:histone acetyltransferase
MTFKKASLIGSKPINLISIWKKKLFNLVEFVAHSTTPYICCLTEFFIFFSSLKGDHTKTYITHTDAQLNRLLKKVLDIETLFSLICKEEDADAKHIYFFLFKLLRKSILTHPSSTSTPTNPSNPSNTSLTLISAPTYPTSVEAHLGRPPFEEPSIAKAIVNFLICKYGSKSSSHHAIVDVDLQYMFEASKMLLYFLNMWKFENPSSFIKRTTFSNNNK